MKTVCNEMNMAPDWNWVAPTVERSDANPIVTQLVASLMAGSQMTEQDALAYINEQPVGGNP